MDDVTRELIKGLIDESTADDIGQVLCLVKKELLSIASSLPLEARLIVVGIVVLLGVSLRLMGVECD